MLLIRNWFKAVAQPADYQIKIEILDDQNQIRRKWTYRPLEGQFPTSLLVEGDVLEDVRLLRFRKLKGTLTVRASLFSQSKRVAGPKVSVGSRPRRTTKKSEGSRPPAAHLRFCIPWFPVSPWNVIILNKCSSTVKRN